MEKWFNYIFLPSCKKLVFLFSLKSTSEVTAISITYLVKSNSDIPIAEKFIELLLC